MNPTTLNNKHCCAKQIIHCLNFQPFPSNTNTSTHRWEKHRTNQYTGEWWEDSEHRTCEEAKRQVWINEKEKMGVVEKQESIKLGEKIELGGKEKVEKLKARWMVCSEEEGERLKVLWRMIMTEGKGYEVHCRKFNNNNKWAKPEWISLCSFFFTRSSCYSFICFVLKKK